jgi:hypothetical protein
MNRTQLQHDREKNEIEIGLWEMQYVTNRREQVNYRDMNNTSSRSTDRRDE